MAARVIEFIVPFNGQVVVKDTEFYRLKIGSLIYLAISTRLDILYKVFILLCFFIKPLSTVYKSYKLNTLIPARHETPRN